jgi:two-component system LytT family sensor kinase
LPPLPRAFAHIAGVRHDSSPRFSFWKLQLVGWGAFAVAMAASRVGRFPLEYMIASKGAMAILGLLYTGAIARPLYRRLLPEDASPLRTIAVTSLVSYAVAALWTGTHSVVDVVIARWLLDPRAHLTGFWSVFGGTLYDAFAMLAWSVLYVGIRHQRALYAARERALRAEALAQQARLEALRLQLNPHFLFNSLNAISSLVLDGQTERATTTIARLADLLRLTLHAPPGDAIPLRDELELVDRYLDIERVRLGERLRVEVDVATDVLDARVPPLLLQPLVENAVRHAVAARADGGRIRIAASRVNGTLFLSVDDDGPGTPETISERGVGLANTRQRLEQRYDARQRFGIERSGLGGLAMRLELPFDGR